MKQPKNTALSLTDLLGLRNSISLIHTRIKDIEAGHYKKLAAAHLEHGYKNPQDFANAILSLHKPGQTAPGIRHEKARDTKDSQDTPAPKRKHTVLPQKTREEIIRLALAGTSTTQIAGKFGVSTQTIRNIKNQAHRSG